MKKQSLLKIIIPFFFLLFVGCSSEDGASENVAQNSLKIDVDGTNYTIINENVGGDENCDVLNINAGYIDQDKIKFEIYLTVSKTGQLIKVRFAESDLTMASQIQKQFLTTSFNPLATFTISDFYYNESTGEVKFNFEGTVFLENNPQQNRSMSGEIKIAALQSFPCTTAKVGINFTSENFFLFSTDNSSFRYYNGIQRHQFVTNNGYFINMLLAGDLWDYTLGEYSFNDDDVLDKVEFREAIAPLVVSQAPIVGSQEWKTYQTIGKIIIQNKYTEHGQKVVSGKLNLEISDNGVLIRTLNEVEFRTYSLVDL